MSEEQQDEHRLIADRRAKLDELREGGNAYPNDFRADAWAADLHREHGDKDNEQLESENIRVSVAGRMMAKRVMGKASFAKIQDTTGQIQLFVQRDALPDGVYRAFKSWDVGDILAGSGTLFRTRMGELSVRVDELRILTKSLRPLPEKFHGLSDQETRYRQRYLDLIVNEHSREVFRKRSMIIRCIRDFMDDRDFLEVETPMMQHIPGGAAARPFVTHHNALDLDLYLRVAPELFLKRLVVGGFERVYEINRNFRNEGVSTRHNPEFTMLEFYQAYADFEDFMAMTEDLMRQLADRVLGMRRFSYQGVEVDLDSTFERLSLRDALLRYNPELEPAVLDDDSRLQAYCREHGIEPQDGWGRGKLQLELFEKTVEDHLTGPVFITHYPIEVSPLSRRNEQNPDVADRFEFFLAGRELANGFSELNDAEDQAARFREQAEQKESGDDEAMAYDADYIRALEYGMPPAAGEGVGIDRLVMLLTDSPSIRDVLLFPYMRPEAE